MLVSFDDGETWQEVPSIRIIQEVEGDEEGVEGELHFNFTTEGLITDLWVEDVCEISSSETYQEMENRMTEV
jgi:hypothetical protein